jgi:hypothetical protein
MSNNLQNIVLMIKYKRKNISFSISKLLRHIEIHKPCYSSRRCIGVGKDEICSDAMDRGGNRF